MAKTVAELVAEAKQRIENLTVEQAAAELAQGDALLVDLRETGELAEQGTIPGAVHAPRGMLEFWADPISAYHRPEFDPNRRVILYCAGGGRSALAADVLQQMGYDQRGSRRGWLQRLEGRWPAGGGCAILVGAWSQGR